MAVDNEWRRKHCINLSETIMLNLKCFNGAIHDNDLEYAELELKQIPAFMGLLIDEFDTMKGQ